MTDLSAVRRCCFLASIFVLALLAVSPRIARPQSTDLSQQMQMFNSLSSDQQQALLQRLGGNSTGTSLGSGSGLSSLLGGSGTGLGSNFNSSQSALLQQEQLQQYRRQQLLDAQNQELVNPTFKPGDTTLIEIGLPGTLPQQTISNTTLGNTQNSLAAAQLLQSGQTAQLNTQNLTTAARPQEQPKQDAEVLEAEQKQKLQDLIDLIRAHNPYQLDSNGELHLPGFPAIALAGLNEDLASRRVGAEPAFERLQLRLTRLPLKKEGQEALKPFGYDLFENSLSFQQSIDSPVASDYVVGPGDVLQVQLYGSQNQSLMLTVNREGRISFPQLGPIDVGGQRYSAVKNDIESRVSRQMIGVRANVTVGSPRGISVFVLGGAKYPGSYTVSGLATVTTALFAAGGVQDIGSLRDIQVKRQGQTVRTLDLYDLLMRGDSSNDINLLPGDVVFIPPVGPTASVDGEVQRPAIYELKGKENISDLIAMGGGLTPTADHDNASLVRVDEQQRRVVMNISPTAGSAVQPLIRNGDTLRVARLKPQLDSGVTVQGFIYRPKYFAWRDGLHLSDVLPSIDELKIGADQNYLLIRRELPPDRRVAVLSADLAAALRAPGSAADVQLMPRDVITVFDLESSREYVIRPLMDELRLESTLAQPTQIVHIDGRVKVPGDYPLETGMHVSDLIRAGGSLDSAAYGGRAELSRYLVENGEERQTQVLSIDLNAVRSGDPTADVALQPFDRLSIKQIEGWTEQDQVTLKGEVRFPGTYTIKRGETLRSVIVRAGGLTDLAFADGSVFTRRELREQEQQQLDRLADRMRTDIAEMALMASRGGQGNSTEAVGIGQTLLDQLKASKAVGRLVINLRASIAAKPGSSDDVILRDGDELVVPKQRQEVMVLGEVKDPTSHLYKSAMSRDDYIDQSGGLSRQADRGQIYVVRADGSVATGTHGWFQSGDDLRIHPGDAIVVPLDTEKLPPLPFWQAVTTIIYNVAIAAAAVHSF